MKPTGSGLPQSKTELPANPVLERFKEPEPPTPLERMIPAIKGMVVGLVVLILLLVALYYVPLPGAEDTAAMDRVTSALRIVKAVPTQHQPVLGLRDAVHPIRNTADASLVAGLLAVVALGEMRTGDRVTATRQCEYIMNTYTGAPAAQLVAPDALSEPCPKCKGSGRVPTSLRGGRSGQSLGDDTVMCMKCQGKGRLFSEAAMDAQYAKALESAESLLKSQNRRGALLSFLLRLQCRLHKAFGGGRSPPPAESPTSTNSPAGT